MKRSPIKRTPPRWRMPIPEPVLQEAGERTWWKCAVCGKEPSDPHHVLPVQGWPQYVHESRNIILLCRDDHARHHSAFRRIRLDELPPEVREWAETVAGWYMEKTYKGDEDV